MTTKATATASAVTLAAGLAGGYLLAPSHLPGDANNDGIVNFDDINSVNQHWGAKASEPGHSPFASAKVYTNGDSNAGEGWQVNGPDNRVLIDAPGEVEDWVEATGARHGGRKFLSHTPDPSQPMGESE